MDRLDYTKGLLERIQAFGELIAEGEISPENAVLVQLAIPSRERVDQYRQLRDDIDRLVGRINGDVGRIGRPPIVYLHTSYPRQEMAALYRAADIMVVTPLRDGMNLVAKEFVACRQADVGALVLSEFAGAAQELRQAYLVNPHDIDGLKERLVEAMKDTPRAKGRRMRLMRRYVVEHDIDHWASTFLNDLDEVGAEAQDRETLPRPIRTATVRLTPARWIASPGRSLPQRILGDRVDVEMARLGVGDVCAGLHGEPVITDWLVSVDRGEEPTIDVVADALRCPLDLGGVRLHEGLARGDADRRLTTRRAVGRVVEAEDLPVGPNRPSGKSISPRDQAWCSVSPGWTIGQS